MRSPPWMRQAAHRTAVIMIPLADPQTAWGDITDKGQAGDDDHHQPDLPGFQKLKGPKLAIGEERQDDQGDEREPRRSTRPLAATCPSASRGPDCASMRDERRHGRCHMPPSPCPWLPASPGARSRLRPAYSSPTGWLPAAARCDSRSPGWRGIAKNHDLAATMSGR